MTEVLSELITNAIEHAESDCLIDINIRPKLHKRGDDSEDEYISFDIVILNLSTLVLGDKVKNKVLNSKTLLPTSQMVIEAFNNHKPHFNDKYNEDDFYDIASFQWRVSGRDNSTEKSGGTGLTTLIKELINQSSIELCYVLTGDKTIYFDKKYLHIDDQMRIGFNEERDFINFPPHRDVIIKSGLELKGTLFHLSFIKQDIQKKHDDNEH